MVNVGHDTGDGSVSALDDVASLLDKSLLLQVEQEGEEPRLQMLMTVREYGLECLRESGEAEAIQRAHALYYLALAEQGEPHLKGAQQLAWLERLEQEQENLRAALQWLIEQKETELALRLCGALAQYWFIRGSLREGRRWLEAALGLRQAQLHPAAKAKALYGAGMLSDARARSLLEESVALYRELGDKPGLAPALRSLAVEMYAQGDSAAGPLIEEGVMLAREVEDTWTLAHLLCDLGALLQDRLNWVGARAQYEESVALFRELGDKQGLARSLDWLAFFMWENDLVQDLVQAEALLKESLILARDLGDQLRIGSVLRQLGFIATEQGNLVQAEALLKESLTVGQEIGHKRSVGAALFGLARLSLLRGDLAQAAVLARESLAIAREIDHTWDITNGLGLLGEIVRDQGELVQARLLFQEALSLAQKIGYKDCIGLHLVGLATIALAERQPRRAALLFGAAEAWPDPHSTTFGDYKRDMANARAQLGEEAFAAAWAQGRAMTPDEALAALEHVTTPEPVVAVPQATQVVKPPSPQPTYPDELTAREVEILRLVAQGWTDGQIAEHLVISPRTVNAHLTSIYRKIGVSSRSAATRYAMEKKLV